MDISKSNSSTLASMKKVWSKYGSIETSPRATSMVGRSLKNRWSKVPLTFLIKIAIQTFLEIYQLLETIFTAMQIHSISNKPPLSFDLTASALTKALYLKSWNALIKLEVSML